MNHLIPRLLSTSTSSTEGVGDTVDGVTKLAGAINEYGVVVVVMAIFFVIFLLLVFLILRNNAKMMDQTLKQHNRSEKFEEDLLARFIDNALNARLGNPTKDIKEQIADSVKEAIKPIQQTVDAINAEQAQDEKVHSDLVGNYIDINMAFKDASRITMDELNCFRIAIYVFHNGNKSMLGLPFFKMSCIHEWTNRGCNTLRSKAHVDMPLHIFTDFVETLWNKGVYRAEDINMSKEEDPSIMEFVNFSKTQSLYMIAVRDIHEKISGFVVAEFENKETFEHDDKRDTEVRAALDKMAARIAPILDYRNTNK